MTTAEPKGPTPWSNVARMAPALWITDDPPSRPPAAFAQAIMDVDWP